MPLSPGTVGDITRLGAAEIARRVSSGELSARDVVEACISHIERVNGRLNALALPLFQQARAAATGADAARDRGDALGPLHGVPVTIKEMFDTVGTATTAGLTRRAAQVADADSPLVDRLRRAGAIVLGKTNVPQLGMLFETDNPVYGRTNNPWDLGRSPGGSSGGEAALIAAGGSPLGLGSDGGGSIRQPCHCCGIHGLKPTGGRLTMRGHWTAPNWRDGWVQPGPMARRVADLSLALSVLAAPVPDKAADAPAPKRPGDPAAVAIGQLRVAAYTDDGYFPPAPRRRGDRPGGPLPACPGARPPRRREAVQGGAGVSGGLGGGGAIALGQDVLFGFADSPSLTLGGDTFGGNLAAGGTGGDGLGGGLFRTTGATLALTACTVTDNLARGGEEGAGGSDGHGVGGGAYNLGTFTSVATIIAHNHAPTSTDDCFGCSCGWPVAQAGRP